MASLTSSAPIKSSCNSCSAGGPEPSSALDGEIRTTGAYRAFSDKVYASTSGRRMPSNGSIELTENCNFRCIHCYQGKNKARQILSGDEWCRILDESVAEGMFWLLITGGEPLLHPEFKRIYMHAIRKGLIVTVFTNGRLVTDEHIQLWTDYPPFSLEITLYGASEEMYQRVTGTRNSFAKVMETARKMKAAGIPLKLKSVAFKPLIDDMAAMKAIAENEIGVKFRFDTKIDPGIYGDSFDDIRPSPEEAVALEEQLIGKPALSDDLRAFFAFNNKNISTPESKEFIYKCGAGRNAFYVDYRGRVHGCSAGRFDEDLDLTKRSFREIWYQEVPKVVFAEAKDKNAVCRTCELRPICDVCPSTAKLATGSKEGRPLYVCQHTMLRKKKFLEERKNESGKKEEAITQA